MISVKTLASFHGMRKSYLALILLLSTSVCLQAQTATVTGTLTNASGGGVGTNAYLAFTLYGCGGNRPIWSGGVITQPFQFYTDTSGAITAAANGGTTPAVVRNDQITCGNDVGNATSYFVQAFVNGSPGPRLQFRITTGSFNWNTAIPITVQPVVPAPTGDSTYIRKDFANVPFTGTFPLTGSMTISSTLGVTGASTLGTGSFGGAWTKGTASSPYILQLTDPGTLNNQVIGFNVEQEANHSGSASWFDFGAAVELFSPSSDTQTFTGDFVGIYGTGNHYGSGNTAAIHGGDFEGFNAGSGTSTLVVGVAATANNGGVASGLPVQTPANTGLATHLRAFDGITKNLSSGAVTDATVFYGNACTKPGGGAIGTCYGIQVADQTNGTVNFAFKSGLGKFQVSDIAEFDSRIGVGIAPIANDGIIIFPSNLTGTGQNGMQVATQCSSAATVNCAGVVARADTAAAAFTNTANWGFNIQNAIKGAGSTITKQVGLEIDTLSSGSTNLAIETGANPSIFGGSVTATNYDTGSNCAAVGTAASPSVASCGSASAGHFSCATNATGATCTVNTTAVTANSEIFVFESDTAVTGTALGVTCNTSTTVVPTSRLLASSVASTSFTINLGTVTTNPACFSYFIVN